MRTIKIIVPDDFDFDPKGDSVYIQSNGEAAFDADGNHVAPLRSVDVWSPIYRDALDKGFLGLVDFMGGDQSVVDAARVSYGTGTRRVLEDRNLIRYLIRKRHWSPVEMVEIMWHVKAPIFVFRQWHRHRTAAINEYSARYSIMSEDMYMPEREALMPQSTSNKQGRSGKMSERNKFAVLIQLQSIYNQCAQAYRYLLGKTKTPDDSLDHRFMLIREAAMKHITMIGKTDPAWAPENITEAMIEEKTQEIFEAQGLAYTDEEFWNQDDAGLSRELARMVMPMGTYSEMYWKCDLRNTFNFMALRSDEHAQEEIRVYSNLMLEMIEPIAPVCVAAFGEYVLRGRQFSNTEMDVARELFRRFGHMNIIEPAKFVEDTMSAMGASKREIREFIHDLERPTNEKTAVA